MAYRTVLFVLAVLAGALFAQSSSESCASEKAAGESCYRQCCESLGYAYDGGCLVSPDQQDSVSSSCGYCTDSYMQCVVNYEGGSSSGSSSAGGSSGSDGGCCGSLVLILMVGVSALITRN